MDERTTVDCVANARALARRHRGCGATDRGRPRIAARSTSTRCMRRGCSACWCRARSAARKSRRSPSCRRSRKSPRPTLRPRGASRRPRSARPSPNAMKPRHRRGDFPEQSARRAWPGAPPATPRRLRKRAAFASPGCGRSPAAAGTPLGLPRIASFTSRTASRAATPTAIRCRRRSSCRANARRSATSGT